MVIKARLVSKSYFCFSRKAPLAAGSGFLDPTKDKLENVLGFKYEAVTSGIGALKDVKHIEGAGSNMRENTKAIFDKAQQMDGEKFNGNYAALLARAQADPNELARMTFELDKGKTNEDGTFTSHQSIKDLNKIRKFMEINADGNDINLYTFEKQADGSLVKKYLSLEYDGEGAKLVFTEDNKEVNIERKELKAYFGTSQQTNKFHNTTVIFPDSKVVGTNFLPGEYFERMPYLALTSLDEDGAGMAKLRQATHRAGREYGDRNLAVMVNGRDQGTIIALGELRRIEAEIDLKAKRELKNKDLMGTLTNIGELPLDDILTYAFEKWDEGANEWLNSKVAKFQEEGKKTLKLKLAGQAERFDENLENTLQRYQQLYRQMAEELEKPKLKVMVKEEIKVGDEVKVIEKPKMVDNHIPDSVKAHIKAWLEYNEADTPIRFATSKRNMMRTYASALTTPQQFSEYVSRNVQEADVKLYSEGRSKELDSPVVVSKAVSQSVKHAAADKAIKLSEEESKALKDNSDKIGAQVAINQNFKGTQVQAELDNALKDHIEDDAKRAAIAQNLVVLQAATWARSPEQAIKMLESVKDFKGTSVPKAAPAAGPAGAGDAGGPDDEIKAPEQSLDALWGWQQLFEGVEKAQKADEEKSKKNDDPMAALMKQFGGMDGFPGMSGADKDKGPKLKADNAKAIKAWLEGRFTAHQQHTTQFKQWLSANTDAVAPEMHYQMPKQKTEGEGAAGDTGPPQDDITKAVETKTFTLKLIKDSGPAPHQAPQFEVLENKTQRGILTLKGDKVLFARTATHSAEPVDVTDIVKFKFNEGRFQLTLERVQQTKQKSQSIDEISQALIKDSENDPQHKAFQNVMHDVKEMGKPRPKVQGFADQVSWSLEKKEFQVRDGVRYLSVMSAVKADELDEANKKAPVQKGFSLQKDKTQYYQGGLKKDEKVSKAVMGRVFFFKKNVADDQPADGRIFVTVIDNEKNVVASWVEQAGKPPKRIDTEESKDIRAFDEALFNNSLKKALTEEDDSPGQSPSVPGTPAERDGTQTKTETELEAQQQEAEQLKARELEAQAPVEKPLIEFFSGNQDEQNAIRVLLRSLRGDGVAVDQVTVVESGQGIQMQVPSDGGKDSRHLLQLPAMGTLSQMQELGADVKDNKAVLTSNKEIGSRNRDIAANHRADVTEFMLTYLTARAQANGIDQKDYLKASRANGVKLWLVTCSVLV